MPENLLDERLKQGESSDNNLSQFLSAQLLHHHRLTNTNISAKDKYEVLFFLTFFGPQNDRKYIYIVSISVTFIKITPSDGAECL